MNYAKFSNDYDQFRIKYGKNKDQGKILYVLIVILNIIASFASIIMDNYEDHEQ